MCHLMQYNGTFFGDCILLHTRRMFTKSNVYYRSICMYIDLYILDNNDYTLYHRFSMLFRISNKYVKIYNKLARTSCRFDTWKVYFFCVKQKWKNRICDNGEKKFDFYIKNIFFAQHFLKKKNLFTVKK